MVRGVFSNLPHRSRTIADNQVYDWLILFDCEVEHIWQRNWGVGKMLFIIARYGPFLYMSITVISKSDPYVIGIRGLLTLIRLFVVHNAPPGTMSDGVCIWHDGPTPS